MHDSNYLSAMVISHQILADVLVVVLQGRFDAPSAPDAERAFKEFLQDGTRKVLLDLSGVEYISSGGLRVIIMVSKALERVQGTLKLCGLTPFVSEVFEITNLSKRYQICPTREEGLEAFAYQEA
ncbi:MAG: STAS domain-containing protein [Candidatus Hydrogenedentes bacterium]|nr:STAS domain-containing protein [Candidatus Hydrogenedentota bacterium]